MKGITFCRYSNRDLRGRVVKLARRNLVSAQCASSPEFDSRRRYIFPDQLYFLFVCLFVCLFVHLTVPTPLPPFPCLYDTLIFLHLLRHVGHFPISKYDSYLARPQKILFCIDVSVTTKWCACLSVCCLCISVFVYFPVPLLSKNNF